MEEDSTSHIPHSEALKRPVSPKESDYSNSNKKLRLDFSVKDFRKKLKNDQRTHALQGFLQLIEEDENHSCIRTYLEHGGNVLEVLQSMEGDSEVSPTLVFDVVNRILLQIGTSLSQYQNTAHVACRYLLNTYLALINKMLSLSSSMRERLVTLKLLTTIVTFSAVLAKEVLLHVNFNPTNVELMTKVGEGKNEARTAFIHFITAFLVDGYFPTLSVLLEKRGLMTSIINGLRFDNADVVVLVLTALKNHILENGSVSKTMKMRTFNTQVIKDIVNLYNWKGPAGIVNHKRKTKVASVDEVDKSRVNEAVHSFLLVLCTSHKHGIIFKDPMLGLGKRQNSLMLTVLESLTRPWGHSYAGELVIKICHACPDLTKLIWIKLLPFVAPRWTEKWLKAMQFAGKLLDGLNPDCMEFAVNNVNVKQLVRVITILSSPPPILGMLTSEDTFDQPATKYHVMVLFLKMITSVENFLKHAETWKNVDHTSLRSALANHVQKHFPDVKLILTNWDQSDEVVSAAEYLDTALDLLEKYKTLAPQLIQDSVLNFDVKEFMLKSEKLFEELSLRQLQIKTVNFFMDLEPALFKPKTQLFKNAVLFSMSHYYFSKDCNILRVLRNLLKNTGVFDGFLTEINFWIDGILNVKNYDANVAVFLCELIEKAESDAPEYNDKLFQLQNANFSSLLLALSDYSVETGKNIKYYLNFVVVNIFHVQTDPSALIEIVSNLPHLSDTLISYISSWNSIEVSVLNKCKGHLMNEFHNFSQNYLQGSLENFDFNLYPDCKLNLLQMMIFYLTNLVKANALEESHKKNCSKFLDHLLSEKMFEDDRYVKTILGNSSLLENFTVKNPNDFSTKFVLDVVKNVKFSFVENYLSDLRQKIVSVILKVFRKPEKNQNIVISMEVLETISLNYEQCNRLLIKFVNSLDNKSFYLIVCYCLNRMAELGTNCDLQPLENDVIKKLTCLLTILIDDQVPNINLLSFALHNYLKVFPHNIEAVEAGIFKSLISLSEFSKENLSFSEFLLDRKLECRKIFEENLDEICSKRSFILAVLDVVVQQYKDDEILERVFNKFENHLIKALQKPHKAGQHFQNRYHSVGILIEKFMKPESFGNQIQKYETAELFHVYLLKKVFDKVEKDGKKLGNMIMTFVHLLMSLLKQKSKKSENLSEIGEIFYEFLQENQTDNINVTHLSSNETLRTFCKFCLKYGVASDQVLIKILTELVKICITAEDAKLIIDMLFSHSQFLDVILTDSPKIELINLWKVICERWPEFMERSHVPILLSAYKATNSELTTLSLLKLYESRPSQTNFFDFKPFLWGRAAASHYSVRSDFRQVLWRQPKMADVLNNLHYSTILATINDPMQPDSYDLNYLLPLFSHLLAPENPVTTYTFTRTGALALTLTGFRGDKCQRLAACHILQRFYFHLEANQTGKDNLLWLRFVEAVCKGVAVLDDFKINSFVGVFLARMALVMTQPGDVMYVPLTQYLGAKDTPDFSRIPELYTFLHSPHVNSKEHKRFILEVIRDGLRSDDDFRTFLKSMGFKLISELCSSTLCDLHTKILILDVFEACCRLNLGVKVLCDSLSFLPQVFGLVLQNIDEEVVLKKLLNILSVIVETDGDRRRNFVMYMNSVVLDTVSKSRNQKCFQDFGMKLQVPSLVPKLVSNSENDKQKS